MHVLAELLSCRQPNRKSHPKETGVVVRRRNIFIESEKNRRKKKTTWGISFIVFPRVKMFLCFLKINKVNRINEKVKIGAGGGKSASNSVGIISLSLCSPH